MMSNLVVDQKTTILTHLRRKQSTRLTAGTGHIRRPLSADNR